MRADQRGGDNVFPVEHSREARQRLFIQRRHARTLVDDRHARIVADLADIPDPLAAFFRNSRKRPTRPVASASKERVSARSQLQCGYVRKVAVALVVVEAVAHDEAVGDLKADVAHR